MATTMWASKLGNRYPMAWMQEKDASSQKELKRLRSLKGSGNDTCADCGRKDTSWASISHGVFICVTCSDVHRSVGTHITKVKGCTGTYLWGPDELEKMQTVGNNVGEEVYGVEKVSPDASKEVKQRFVVDKYEKRLFARKTFPIPSERASQPAIDMEVNASQNVAPAAEQKELVVRKTAAPNNRPAQKQPSANATATVAPAVAREIVFPDSLFDELFNEAQHECTASAPTWPKSIESQETQPLPPKAVTAHNSLDAFLDSALRVPSVQQKHVVDPFSDWPDF